MRRNCLLITILVSLLLAFGGRPVLAQNAGGTITGTVIDPAGAVVANSDVVAKNTQTGATYAAQTTATGNYTIVQLPVASYELSVMTAGFKTFRRTGITVPAAQIVRVDVTLEVGAASESVTVQAEASML